VPDLASLLALARSGVGIARSKLLRRTATRLAGRGPLQAWIKPNDVYSGFGLVTAIEDDRLSAEPTIEEIRAIEPDSILVVPGVLSGALRLPEHEEAITLEEFYLVPLETSEPPSGLAAIAYQLPGAGGRGEEAEFAVSFRRGLEVSVPLFQAAIRAGGDVTQPMLAPSDGYGFALTLFPSGRGLYSFALKARIRRADRVYEQVLVDRFRVLVIDPNDATLFERTVRVVYDRVDVVQPLPPAQALANASNAEARKWMPPLAEGRAFAVSGRAVGRTMWPEHWKR
jgi:hypothetical protein